MCCPPLGVNACPQKPEPCLIFCVTVSAGRCKKRKRSLMLDSCVQQPFRGTKGRPGNNKSDILEGTLSAVLCLPRLMSVFLCFLPLMHLYTHQCACILKTLMPSRCRHQPESVPSCSLLRCTSWPVQSESYPHPPLAEGS